MKTDEKEQVDQMIDKVTTIKRTNTIVALVILCILLFAALRGYFRADDFAHLQTSKFSVIRNPVTIITESEFSGHYRPMVKVFFGITYLVFGLKPFGYFIMSISIFILTIYIFLILVKVLSGNILRAYCAVLLLLLQVNTYLYTVNWIGAVTVILSVFFSITMFFFYIKSIITVHRANLYYLLSLISFSLSLLSREITVVMIAVLLAYDFLFLWLEAPAKTEVLRKRFFSHVPFWFLFVGYVLVRSAVTEAQSLLGESDYTFTLLGSNVLHNLIFYGMQLGFLPIAVLLLSIPSLFLDKLQLAKRDLKLIALGIFLAVGAILPFLLFRWTSPTWMYLSAFGTALASSTLFQRVFSDSSRRKGALLFYGTLICALVGSFLLFSRLSEARWWQWGTYSRNVIEQVKAYYPNLPPGATLYFIDKNEQESYGIEGLFRFNSYLGAAFRVWYDDASLHAYIMDEASSIEDILEEKRDEENSAVFVFEYDEGSILDKTSWFQGLGE